MTLTLQFKVTVRVTFHNSAYISAILGPILTKFRLQRRHRDRQQKNSYLLTFKMQIKITIYKKNYISTIIRPILTQLHRNDVTVACNKIANGFTMKIYIKVTIHTNHIAAISRTDFNQIFIKMMQLWITSKPSHQLTLKNVGKGHISHLGYLKPI